VSVIFLQSLRVRVTTSSLDFINVILFFIDGFQDAIPDVVVHDHTGSHLKP
jgi:hypothetical protein